jgi:hypothetical protein
MDGGGARAESACNRPLYPTRPLAALIPTPPKIATEWDDGQAHFSITDHLPGRSENV